MIDFVSLAQSRSLWTQQLQKITAFISKIPSDWEFSNEHLNMWATCATEMIRSFFLRMPSLRKDTCQGMLGTLAWKFH